MLVTTATSFMFVITSTLLQTGHALTSEEKSVLTASGDVTLTVDGENYIMSSSGVPDHPDTADFPTNYNPNSIETQNHRYVIPMDPQEADEPGCLPMGPIGMAKNGVAMYNPYTAEQNDAVVGENKETFDDCNGHPDQSGTYHYHQNPNCVYSGTDSQLIGIAFDGIPVYSFMYKDNGDKYTSADLLPCHGLVIDGSFRYIVTEDFPYILGCYYGQVTSDVEKILDRPNCETAISPDSDGSSFFYYSRPVLASMVMMALVLTQW